MAMASRTRDRDQLATERDVYDEFERLWCCYASCLTAADSLGSPNPEDNSFIKLAIVGFSHHDNVRNWQPRHYQIAREYLDECEKLDDSDNTKRFNMLALGALLGLYSSGKIDDRVYRIGYILLPGFVMAKGDAIDGIGTSQANPSQPQSGSPLGGSGSGDVVK
jgi:hypothetical protein